MSEELKLTTILCATVLGVFALCTRCAEQDLPNNRAKIVLEMAKLAQDIGCKNL